MSIMNFTTEEINIISIYKANTLAATIATLDEIIMTLLNEDILTIAESAGRKLSTLTELEFSELSFSLVDEYEE